MNLNTVDVNHNNTNFLNTSENIQDNKMDYRTLGTLLPRYFRVVGDVSRDLSEVKITECPIQKIPWTVDYYAIPGCTELPLDEIDSNKSHRAYGLYPMDVASAIAIMVLNPCTDRDINVLDLCCCPGNKLGMIAERVSPDSLVVGVDISESRLNVCRSLLRSWSEPFDKFKSKESARQLVFRGDGIQFSTASTGTLFYDSNITKEELSMFGGVKKRNKSYIKREQKRLKSLESSISTRGLPQDEDDPTTCAESVLNFDRFDYVLVDAECTHDASYKHMQFIPENTKGETTTKEESAEKKTFRKRQASLAYVTDTTGDLLRDLQRSLLANGFRNLKPGGVLVYSTCSQAREQNEDVVQWFLDSAADQAELLPVLDTLRDVLPPLDAASPSAGLSDSDGSAVAFGTGEFRFDLSDPANPLRLLQLDPEQFMQTLSASYPTAASQRELSHAICDAMASQTRPAVAESDILPGTVKLGYKGGMSGHFIAKIRKIKL